MTEILTAPPAEKCRNCGHACEHGYSHAIGCQEGCIEAPCFEPTPEGRAFAEDFLGRIEVVLGRKHPAAIQESTDRVRDQIGRLFDAHSKKLRYQAQ